MDELGHRLRLFFIEFMYEQVRINLLWKVANRSLSSTLSTLRASLLKRVMSDRRLSFSPCSMVNKLDKECLCLCPPMKLLTNNLLNSSKELTESEGILLNQTRAGPLSKEDSTHYFIRNPLKMHSGLKGGNVIKQVACSIIRIQRRQLEL